jgi:hypothetical protein
LFDYEATYYSDSEVKFTNSGFIGITGNDTVRFMKSKQDLNLSDSDSSLEQRYSLCKAFLSVVKYKYKYFCFTKDRYTNDK